MNLFNTFVTSRQKSRVGRKPGRKKLKQYYTIESLQDSLLSSFLINSKQSIIFLLKELLKWNIGQTEFREYKAPPLQLDINLKFACFFLMQVQDHHI